MDSAMNRRSDSSPTIPAPAIKCAHVYPSGKACTFNACDGAAQCHIHIATPALRRYEATK